MASELDTDIVNTLAVQGNGLLSNALLRMTG